MAQAIISNDVHREAQITIHSPTGDLTVHTDNGAVTIHEDDGLFRLSKVLTVETEFNTPRPGLTTIYATRSNGTYGVAEGEGISVVDLTTQ